MLKLIKNSTSRSGLSLVELILVVAFASIIIASSLVFNAPLKHNTRQSEKRFTAFNLISSQLETLLYTAKTDWSNTDLNAGANFRAQTSDITVPPTYTLSYQITDKTDWVEDNEPNGTDTGGAEYKRITIKCTYPITVNTNKTAEITITGFAVKP